ncbi:DsrE family protein [Pseudarthrobacter sp. HLT3-5]|uniref:DsrE family protein n=1 Tax=Pseudarthrobacter cellobiosi TaxID=2953654 RepID=UPI00208EF417|nr:DsrE family protein [Pseudarthrobacter sp. HLT3-5]MCO4276031.1 DsrE family protein [Pseudarthrobacter sp. HLT3-5]
MSDNEGTPVVPQAPNGPGLLIHAAGPLEPDTLAGILRSSANARAALEPGAAIEVVVQGPGVRLLTADSPVSETITHTRQLDVEVLACANSMRSAGLETEDLTAGISTFPAAVAHLAERQWQGWAYVRP